MNTVTSVRIKCLKMLVKEIRYFKKQEFKRNKKDFTNYIAFRGHFLGR